MAWKCEQHYTWLLAAELLFEPRNDIVSVGAIADVVKGVIGMACHTIASSGLREVRGVGGNFVGEEVAPGPPFCLVEGTMTGRGQSVRRSHGVHLVDGNA